MISISSSSSSPPSISCVVKSLSFEDYPPFWLNILCTKLSRLFYLSIISLNEAMSALAFRSSSTFSWSTFFSHSCLIRVLRAEFAPTLLPPPPVEPPPIPATAKSLLIVWIILLTCSISLKNSPVPTLPCKFVLSYFWSTLELTRLSVSFLKFSKCARIATSVSLLSISINRLSSYL